MTPDLLLVLHLFLFAVTLLVLYLLVKRYQRQPALWPVPGIYCGLLLFYFLASHLGYKLINFFSLPYSLLSDIGWVFLFFALVCIFLLFRYGGGSSKRLLALALALGFASIVNYPLLFNVYHSLQSLLHLKLKPGGAVFIAGVNASMPFCMLLLIKALWHKRHKPFQASALLLFAATNLGVLICWFSLFLLIYFFESSGAFG